MGDDPPGPKRSIRKMVMKARPMTILGLPVLALLLTAMSPAARAVQLETCVNTICLGNKAPTFDSLSKQIGTWSRATLTGLDTARTICLYDVASNASAVFSFSGDSSLVQSRLDGIFVTRGPICDPVASPQRHAASVFRSKRGIALGDHKDKVISVLGNPDEIRDAAAREARDSRYANSRLGRRYGTQRLHYGSPSSPLLFNEYGLDEEGRVVSIWLSDSP